MHCNEGNKNNENVSFTPGLSSWAFYILSFAEVKYFTQGQGHITSGGAKALIFSALCCL